MVLRVLLLLGALLMPAPSNTSAATAIDLGSLPATYAQQVDDAGTTYTVWHKFTAPAGAKMALAWSFGDLSVYRPTLEPFTGPAGAPVSVLSIVSLRNRRIQFPVTAGTEYFLKTTKNAGNPAPANLSLNVAIAADDAPQNGDIVVNDDTDGFPCAVLVPDTDYLVRCFKYPVVSGEGGDILVDGTILLENRFVNEIRVYDKTFANTATLVSAGSGAVYIRANRATNKFYALFNKNPAALVKTIGADGTYGPTTWTLTGTTNGQALAASNDESILYYTRLNDSTIRTWNLSTDSAGPDFLASLGGSWVVPDIIVLDDDSLLIAYFENAGSGLTVKHYSAAGALLNSVAYANSSSSVIPRMAYALDSPLSFWVWVHDRATGDGVNRFINTRVSDVATIRTRLGVPFDQGAYALDETATPLAIAGHSSSCPFFIMRGLADQAGTGEHGTGGANCLTAPPEMGCWGADEIPQQMHTVGAQPTTPPAAACWSSPYDNTVQEIGLINEDVQP